jgi:quercetin dioxygenase-like cupin family protein
MTTFASPTQGPSQGLSMWRVEIEAGRSGPVHVFDSEQVWHLVTGEAEFLVDGVVVPLAAGDSLVLPADAVRQLTAGTDAAFLVCGHGTACAWIPGEDAPRGTPPWIG